MENQRACIVQSECNAMINFWLFPYKFQCSLTFNFVPLKNVKNSLKPVHLHIKNKF